MYIDVGSGPSAKSRLLEKRMLRYVLFGGLLSISCWYISGCSVFIVSLVFLACLCIIVFIGSMLHCSCSDSDVL